jgi:hypothetical protein
MTNKDFKIKQFEKMRNSQLFLIQHKDFLFKFNKLVQFFTSINIITYN